MWLSDWPGKSRPDDARLPIRARMWPMSTPCSTASVRCCGLNSMFGRGRDACCKFETLRHFGLPSRQSEAPSLSYHYHHHQALVSVCRFRYPPWVPCSTYLPSRSFPFILSCLISSIPAPFFLSVYATSLALLLFFASPSCPLFGVLAGANS
ncbi:hypothetical protein VTI28DRAFT_2921 [Corynascus sepedonium]